ncbi:MAG: (d)CMP kinase, partial [Planctomycetota bacterium]
RSASIECRDGEFITLFIAQVDIETNTLTYCSCGHEPALLLRGCKVIELDEGGMVLGILPETEYVIKTVEFKQGDLLLMYTDGLIDAMNFEGQIWGKEPMLKALKKCPRVTAEGFVHNLLRYRRRFSGLASQTDDTSIVVIRRDDNANPCIARQRRNNRIYNRMHPFIITIDGPAGVGKSTVARMLAKEVSAVFLDTGASYRAVTVAAMNAGVDPTDAQAVLAVMDRSTFDFRHEGDVLRVFIDGKDATVAIREPQITENVKHIAGQPQLRSRLVKLQKEFAAQFDKVVTEGRDQGTVVFPEAHFKFFLTADPKERTRRRHEELKAAGKEMDFDALHEQITRRDASDQNRAVSPLKPADDAIHIDTTHIDAAGVVNRMLEVIEAQHG